MTDVCRHYIHHYSQHQCDIVIIKAPSKSTRCWAMDVCWIERHGVLGKPEAKQQNHKLARECLLQKGKTLAEASSPRVPKQHDIFQIPHVPLFCPLQLWSPTLHDVQRFWIFHQIYFFIHHLVVVVFFTISVARDSLDNLQTTVVCGGHSFNGDFNTTKNVQSPVVNDWSKTTKDCIDCVHELQEEFFKLESQHLWLLPWNLSDIEVDETVCR